MIKRLFDLLVSGVGLLLLLPVFIFIAILIKLESSGPVYFRQNRVGRRGKIFSIFKFRTMVENAECQGLQITVGQDIRVTRVGAYLRKYKLDELAQLINVFMGDMSLVGPRPEVPHYVAYYPSNLRELVLSVRPGITDRASIEFRNENEILDCSADPYSSYVNKILPIKLRYYQEYVNDHSFFGDILLIFLTLRALFR